MKRLLWVVLAVQLASTTIAQTPREVVPAVSPHAATYGIAGYRLDREGSTVTAEAIGPNEETIAVLVVAWEQGRITRDYTDPTGRHLQTVIEPESGVATIEDLQTGQVDRIEWVWSEGRAPEGDRPMSAEPKDYGRWSITNPAGQPRAENEAIRTREARALLIETVIYEDIVHGLRLLPNDPPEVGPGVADREKTDRFGFLPCTSCFGPLHDGWALGVTSSGCCSSVRLQVANQCTNSFCTGCCYYVGCRTQCAVQGYDPLTGLPTGPGSLCLCFDDGRSCSEGTQPFCIDPPEWPPDCV